MGIGALSQTLFGKHPSGLDTQEAAITASLLSGPNAGADAVKVQAETFFAQDIPTAASEAYRVAAQPSGWALMGDSTGGYCAAKLAILQSLDERVAPQTVAQALIG